MQLPGAETIPCSAAQPMAVVISAQLPEFVPALSRPDTLPVLINWEESLTGSTFKLGEHPPPASWICRLGEHRGMIWGSKYMVVPISPSYFFHHFSLHFPFSNQEAGCTGRNVRSVLKERDLLLVAQLSEGHSDPVPLSTVGETFRMPPRALNQAALEGKHRLEPGNGVVWAKGGAD